MPEPEGGRIVAGADGRFTLRTGQPTADLALLAGWAAEAGLELQELAVSPPTLEDVYLEITG